MNRKWSAIGFTSRAARTVFAVRLALSAPAQQDPYQEALEKYQSKQYREALPLAEEALREEPPQSHLPTPLRLDFCSARPVFSRRRQLAQGGGAGSRLAGFRVRSWRATSPGKKVR
jgi:hypothetical protein